ncbi:MAG: diaminopimelate epimerase [Rikenellaceae bacterium]
MKQNNVIQFYKYQGAGNDFVLIDNTKGDVTLTSEQIAQMCNRNIGIGSDGLMMLEKDENYDFYMRYFNADSSEVAMCGNGGRCIVLFAQHLGIIKDKTTFNSLDGIHTAEVIEDDGFNGTVRVKLIDVYGVAEYKESLFLNTGVPHYIEFVKNIEFIDIQKVGSEIRYNERFRPDGTNANFVEVTGEGTIKVRTYERGVEGETLACGTGATASAIATCIKYQPDTTSFLIKVMGGELKVDFEKVSKESYKNIYLEGPAKFVFQGKIYL